jgi:hypothetical protein
VKALMPASNAARLLVAIPLLFVKLPYVSRSMVLAPRVLAESVERCASG